MTAWIARSATKATRSKRSDVAGGGDGEGLAGALIEYSYRTAESDMLPNNTPLAVGGGKWQRLRVATAMLRRYRGMARRSRVATPS